MKKEGLPPNKVLLFNGGKLKKNTLKKENVIEKIAKEARFSKKDVRLILDTFILVLEDAVEQQIEVKIRGLGTLSYVPIKEHFGFDAKNRKKIFIKGFSKVNFKLSDNIKNANRESKETTAT